MKEDTNILEPLFQRVEEYGKVSYVLFKLKALEKTTGVVSTFVSRGSVVLVLAMCLIVVTIGVSLWLGELLGKLYYGFFLVAGVYALVGIILYHFMNNLIRKRVMNSIISQMLNPVEKLD